MRTAGRTTRTAGRTAAAAGEAPRAAGYFARADSEKLRDPLAYVRTKMWQAKYLPFVRG